MTVLEEKVEVVFLLLQKVHLDLEDAYSTVPAEEVAASCGLDADVGAPINPDHTLVLKQPQMPQWRRQYLAPCYSEKMRSHQLEF